jgi:folate-binding protein YgfZ
VRVQGKDRLEFLHRLTTNDLVGAAPGQGRYTAFLNTRGRVVDLALVLLGEEEILVIPSAGNAAKIAAFLDGYLFREEVVLQCEADPGSALLFGEGAAAALGRATKSRWSQDLGDHRACQIGAVAARVARLMPMQGECYLVLFPVAAKGAVESELHRAGASPALNDTLERSRVEAMIPALGHELSEEYNPWEVSLDRAIHLQKGCYLGQEVVARLHTYKKVQRRLAGFELSQLPAQLPAPLFSGAQSAGTLTSAAPAPAGDRVLGLGVARSALCRPGQELRAGAPDSPIVCRVRDAAPPFSESFAGPS